MRIYLINSIVIIFLLFSCNGRRSKQDLSSFKIILFESSDRNIRLMDSMIYSDSSFNYRIEGYGHPNIYVVLTHSHLDENLNINFSNIEIVELVDSDTIEFNDWFAIDNDEKTYIVFKEDFERLKTEKDKDRKIKLYEIYVLAKSIE
ncbi:hypothetical protein LV84_01614 [Algoriphagus ratkowskyi]|uniref:Lipoprotein n=1 Tax=Algoriphagus ratkowskyi TaxID=57028 RepID=A0A2W7RH37_9BACT|nr:hypothetical protein [Algoriphagus ratkowskyi]PZX58406.1 hypothetical protein LV84_01614 [Algoriphagus ratkowskyi]TXD77726.1 hypothetical protein ESW18_10150 [Algoriphagus ratkowskyi]